MLKNFLIGFEVLTAVVMKSYILCDITPRSPLKAGPDIRWINQGGCPVVSTKQK
jgi:hypothetical protein